MHVSEYALMGMSYAVTSYFRICTKYNLVATSVTRGVVLDRSSYLTEEFDLQDSTLG